MQIKIGKKNNEGDKTYLKEYIYIIRTHISHTNIHLVMKIEKKKLSGNRDKDGYSSLGDMGSPVLYSSNWSFLTIVMTLNFTNKLGIWCNKELGNREELFFFTI